MVKKLVNGLRIFIVLILVVQLTGCGTILYPEREGQKSGTIDAGVAVLDCVGLFIFIIPGLVALAADFYNGTIYLPATLSNGPLVGNTQHEIKETVHNAGETLKSAGRNAAAAIRRAL